MAHPEIKPSIKGFQDLLFFAIRLGKDFNNPTPTEEIFVSVIANKFEKATLIKESADSLTKQTLLPKKYLSLKNVDYFIAMPPHEENVFKDFFKEFKNKYRKKQMKLFKKKALTVFTLNIPYLIEAQFKMFFQERFPREEMFNGVVRVCPKKEDPFKDFLKNFHH